MNDFVSAAKSKKSTSGDRKISKADSVIKKTDIVHLNGEKDEDTGTEAGTHLLKVSTWIVSMPATIPFYRTRN